MYLCGKGPLGKGTTMEIDFIVKADGTVTEDAAAIAAALAVIANAADA